MKKILSILMLLVAIVTGAKAADEVVVIGSNSSGAYTISGTTHDVAGYSNGTNSGTIADADDGQGASAGSKMNSTTNIGSALSSKGHVRFTVSAGETVRFYYYCQSSSKATTISTSDYSQSKSNYDSQEVSIASKNTLYYVDFVYENAGTYAISHNGDNIFAAALKFTAAPAGPSITTQPQSAQYASGDPISALTVEATASKGDLAYQWYTCDDAEKTNAAAIDGATSASYTPTAAGFYYVNVADANGDLDSDVAQITISAAEAPTINVSGAPAEVVKVGTEVILTATATGVPTPTIKWYKKNTLGEVETGATFTVPTDEAGEFTYYAVATNSEGSATSDDQVITVKEQVATPTFNPNGAYFEESQSVVIESATEDAVIEYSTDGGESWTAYTEALNITETTTIIAKATKQDYLNSETATATFTKVTLDPQADVTGATTWDWSDATNTSNIDLTGTAIINKDVLYTNISQYGVTAVTGLADQDKLVMNGQYAYRKDGDNKFMQGNSLKFNTTVAGTVTVVYANTGNNAARTVNVNGVKGKLSSEKNTTYKTETFAVGVGSVLIKGVQVSDNADKMLRIKSVEFTPFAAQDITVGATGFATIGLPFATTVPAGVTAYAVESVDGSKVKMSSAIDAGTTIPANKGFVIVAAPNTYSFAPVASSSYEGTDVLEATGINEKAATEQAPIYVLTVTDATNKKVGFKKATTGSLGAYKAYLPGNSELGNTLSLSFKEDDPTAVEAIAEANEADAEAPVKVIKNGKLFIGNYNVAGQQVK